MGNGLREYEVGGRARPGSSHRNSRLPHVPCFPPVSLLSLPRFMAVGRRPRRTHGRGSAGKGFSTLGAAPKTSPWTPPRGPTSSAAWTRSSAS